MAETTPSVYLVNAYQDPVVVQVAGRASYLNCGPVNDFFERMIREGRRQFVVDLGNCTGMDSTFLGLLVSTGFALAEALPAGNLVLVRLNARLLELVLNVGLHRIVTVDGGDYQPAPGGEPLEADARTGAGVAANARLVLKAHEALSEIDEANRKQFQDVVSFLRGQVEGAS